VAEPKASIGALVICAICGATLLLADGHARQASYADTEGLSSADREILVAARVPFRRLKRHA
jgi:hypothetical protein